MAAAVALRRLAVAALLLGCMLAGCGDPGRSLPPEWKGRDLAEPGWANETVQQGWTMGLEYVWSSGQKVQWDWLAEGKTVLYFQIVRMENGQGTTLVGQHRDNSTGRITVPTGGQYQVLFRNEAFNDAKLWYRMPEGAMERLYPPGQGPDCFFLLGRAHAAATAGTDAASC